MMQWFIYAFILGFAGSFHCVGMCGAIALSLPIQHLHSTQKNFGILFYNIGRIITYAIIGLFLGLIGRAFYIGGLQQTISIVVGIVMLLFVVANYLTTKKVQLKFILKFQVYIQAVLGNFLVKQSLSSSFFIGLLNGLLPCGMVYFALAAALTSTTIYGSIFFMIMFGIGTIPLMILVSYFGVFVNLSLRNSIKKAMPYFMLCIGVLFILRGLNLNIPFISPLIDNAAARTISCH
ncbi:MAG: sulfite exporter TauE/SafE family protein [Bacteroidetes bacterium]|jgi:sulfite exporter TauE/SafE|nr:sulfite exporter TauE/SafE family protein [Bacteroidota bacterium]